MLNLLKNCNTLFPNKGKTYPIAEEIVQLLADKKISYAEACEALNIALEGIKTLIIS